MNVAFIEMGVTHANTCNSFLISLKEMLLSLYSLHITLMLLYWAILLHHSLSLFSRHLPSFIILTRGFLCFPLINPCLHCWTILVYALGFCLSHGNIVSHLTYLDCFSFLALSYRFLHGIRAWLLILVLSFVLKVVIHWSTPYLETLLRE